MYICVCKAVSEKKLIDTTARRGCSVKEACKLLGAGGDCGLCKVELEQKTNELDSREYKNVSRKESLIKEFPV